MENGLAVEEELRVLFETIDERRRYDAAHEWKKQGKKVIGFISDYVPEELIFAAGMFPYRIIGSWNADVSKAIFYRPTNTDLYSIHVLQSLLEGKLDFLDGIIIPHLDDDQRRLWDVWSHLKKASLIYYLYIPRKESDFCIMEFRNGLVRLKENLEELGAKKISDESIESSIVVYNRWRKIMMDLLELRKREVPPLSGSEFLALTVSSFVMPKDMFTERIESILDPLKKRIAPVSKNRPRLLVSSEDLDNPAYLELVENCGCLVSMDD
jgi:benzoyl-CoA reductase/2-hydroxyglutaryl-CoA dehydratase subunit BcrC/BadD/HgdB